MIVHVADATDRAQVEHVGLVAPEAAARLAGDARRQVVVENADGSPIVVGRTQRTVTPWLLRALHRRDHCCRFPGCERTRNLHAHHIVHWLDGGATDLRNLVLLCAHHHHYVHEAQWAIRGDPAGGLEIRRPNGTVFAVGPGPPG